MRLKKILGNYNNWNTTLPEFLWGGGMPAVTHMVGKIIPIALPRVSSLPVAHKSCVTTVYHTHYEVRNFFANHDNWSTTLPGFLWERRIPAVTHMDSKVISTPLWRVKRSFSHSKAVSTHVWPQKGHKVWAFFADGDTSSLFPFFLTTPAELA